MGVADRTRELHDTKADPRCDAAPCVSHQSRTRAKLQPVGQVHLVKTVFVMPIPISRLVRFGKSIALVCSFRRWRISGQIGARIADQKDSATI